MKFEISFECAMDDETGKITASVKGDVPDDLLSAAQKLATAFCKVVEHQMAAKEAKTLSERSAV